LSLGVNWSSGLERRQNDDGQMLYVGDERSGMFIDRNIIVMPNL